MLSRRQFLRASCLISGGLALGVACGPQPGGRRAGSHPGPGPGSYPGAGTAADGRRQLSRGPAATTASAGAPKKGGTLRVALTVDVTLLDPLMSGSKLDRQVYHNLYDPLLVLDEKLGIQPNLAESWQTPDPKTLILKLRQGVKFHDGTDFNAEAARINFDRMANDPKSVRKGEVANIASTEAVDPLTLKINLKQPDSSLLATLTDRAGMMVSPAAIQKLGADLQHDATGAGTGPSSSSSGFQTTICCSSATTRTGTRTADRTWTRSAIGRFRTTRSSCRACRAASSTPSTTWRRGRCRSPRPTAVSW